MLYSEQIKQFAEKLGVDPAQHKDGLYGTMMKAIYDACGSGGGSGGVSSWNDLTDKPFGMEIGDIAILPETTIEVDPDGGEVAIADVIPVVVGNSYKVYWNGTEYPCIAGGIDMDGVPLAALGNLGAMTGEGMTEEPFLLIAFPADIAAAVGAGVAVMALDGSTSATVSITGQGEIVKKIDSKYLPDGIPICETFGEPVLPATRIPPAEGFCATDAQFGEVVAGSTYKITAESDEYESVAERSNVDGIPCTILPVGQGGVSIFDTALNIGGKTITAVVDLPGRAGGNFTLSIGTGCNIRKIDERCMPDIPGVFWVNFDRQFVDTDVGSIFTPDATHEEVFAAHEKNNLIVARVGDSVYNATSVSGNEAHFLSTYLNTSNSTLKVDVLMWIGNSVREIQGSVSIMGSLYDKTNPY